MNLNKAATNRKKKYWLSRLAVAITVFSSSLCSAYIDTVNVKIKRISAYSLNNGNILVQTEPRHNMEGLSCTNDYWLVLAQSDPGFENTLSMLLTAQTAQIEVIVRAENNGASAFCLLSRLTTVVD